MASTCNPVGKEGVTEQDEIAPPVLLKTISVIAVPLIAITSEAFATTGAGSVALTVISTVAVSLPVTFVAVTV